MDYEMDIGFLYGGLTPWRGLWPPDCVCGHFTFSGSQEPSFPWKPAECGTAPFQRSVSDDH